MTQEEWFWVYDARRTDKPNADTFGLSETDLADLYELIKDG